MKKIIYCLISFIVFILFAACLIRYAAESKNAYNFSAFFAYQYRIKWLSEGKQLPPDIQSSIVYAQTQASLKPTSEYNYLVGVYNSLRPTLTNCSQPDKDGSVTCDMKFKGWYHLSKRIKFSAQP